METNNSMQVNIVRVITIYAKAVAYTLLVALVTGVAHPIFLGFHPVLQGLLLGLIAGTIAGKLLLINEYRFRSPLEPYLISLALLIAYLAGQWIGISIAFDHNNWSFLLTTWKLDEFRDMIQWRPFPETGDYMDKVARSWWMTWFITDALFFFLVSRFSLNLAFHASRKKKKRSSSEWPIYRMLAIYICFVGSLCFFTKDTIGSNLQGIRTWKQELWADSMVTKVYRNIEGLVSDGLTPEAFALEDVTEAMNESDYPFPEGHLLLALEHIRKANLYLAKDDIDRAIFQTEGLKRRVTLENGERIDADAFLPHLYQFRAKLVGKLDKDLLAEQNLILAINMLEDDASKSSPVSDAGFYAHEGEILNEAGLQPQFGLAACYYDRYLIRLKIDADQAEPDLKKALSLGFVVSE